MSEEPREHTIRVLVSRFRAGDSVRSLARDYGTTEASVQDCIRWALRRYRGPAPLLEATEEPPHE